MERLYHTATQCNTLPNAATRCNALQCTEYEEVERVCGGNDCMERLQHTIIH